MAIKEKAVETTTLDDDVTKPSVTAPGDGPADTTDPTEIASTVTPRPGPEALAVGTVNGVVKVEPPKSLAPTSKKSEDRVETYKATRPNGDVVTVRHNIDTGDTEIVD